VTLADALNIMLAGKKAKLQADLRLLLPTVPQRKLLLGSQLHMDVNCARIMIEIEFFFLAFRGGSDIVNTWTP
jgi:hypothetical protein